MKTKRRRNQNTIVNIMMFAVVFGVLCFCLVFVQTKLLQNAEQFGDSLAKSYAIEEELRLDMFEKFLNLASEYVDTMELQGNSTEEIQVWLAEYFQNITDVVGGHLMDPYAVINGEIVAAVPWEGDDTYDYHSKDWYTKAVEANGKLIVGDVYQDAITKKNIYTLSKELTTDGNVIAMDIFIFEEDLHIEEKTLPNYSTLYVCDQNGMILYSISSWQKSNEGSQKIASRLFSEIHKGKYQSYQDTFTDTNGVECGVYFGEMENGRIVILTIPTNEILVGSQDQIINILLGVATIYILVFAAFVLRGRKQSKEILKADNTIGILSNSYTALYRVYFKEGTYETIKKNVNGTIPESGTYESLLDYICRTTKENTSEELKWNFSLQTICHRIEEGILDYGGDFLRQVEDGYKWMNIRTIYNKELCPDEVLLCLKEVDDEKKQQLQHMIILQDAIETSKKSVRAKADFFSHVSHDLRTPLNAIIGFSELAIQQLQGQETEKEYIQKILFAGKQMLSLVNDILEISKIEAGKNRLQCRQFDIKEYVEKSISIFQAQAIQEHKYFRVEFHITHREIHGDAFKIGQILNNLLSNAFKYSHEGATIRLEIREFMVEKYSKFQFRVEDTGIGISQEFIDTIFEPYSREDTFLETNTVGTGLGMTIVKSLVKQMSGEIAVESEVGKGSCFVVTIPLELASRNKDCSKEDRVDTNINLKGKKILVVEDNMFNMELTTELLKIQGCVVLQAVNGKEAIEIFQKSSPYSIDAILMDMQMPEMDGCTAATKIRALNKVDAKTIPIIAVTANAFSEDISRTTKAGMNSHISKPVDINLLCRTLETYIK